jgi:anti-sigma factor RsiW
MDCSHFQARIDRRLDGELDYLEIAGLERHLDSCVDCAAESAETSAVRSALAAWGSVELTPPPGFAQRVIAAVEREPAVGAARPFRRAVDGRLQEIDGLLGRVALPGGRSMLVRNLIGWGLAAVAVFIGIEHRHVRRSRELRPS